ncbi:MAG: hypothetical protein V1813_01080 [Candidatus Aenigmatarchaeota archaeon]
MDTYRSRILRGIEFADLSNLKSYGREYGKRIRYLYGRGSLSENETEKEIAKALLENMKRTAGEYGKLVAMSRGFDNRGIKRPEVLANVLPMMKGAEETIFQDYGVTASAVRDFCQKYSMSDLLRTLMSELLEPAEPAGLQ